MKVTPSFIVSFETEIKGIVEDNWARVQSMLHWDQFMKVRPSSTKREILVWLLETAKIYPEGNGGNTRFDDMVAATFAYENFNAGAGLKLTKNEIEDNQINRDGTPVGVLDYAGKWANDISKAAMFYPQQQALSLITNGKTQNGYDGVTFFNAAHPVNPNGGGGTYSNIISAVPINAAPSTTEVDAVVVAQKNLAKALAAVRAQKFINGIPRYLNPTVLLVPTALQFRAQQLTGAGVLGLSTNVLQDLRLKVVVDPLLDAEPDVYYLGVEDMMSNDLGAFIWSEREPFALRTYSMVEEAFLNHRDEFEWTMKGRNAAVYGHPYLFYRCEPT